MALLLGDIGGTNLRLCIYEDEEITKTQVFSTTKYPVIEDAIKEFSGSAKITKCCLAIAGPVINHGDYETVVLTNQDHKLEYNSKELSAKVGYPCKFINDFAAIGYYLTAERMPECFKVLHEPANPPVGERTCVYLGAGTGLGVGFLYGKTVFSSEGGHVRFTPENAFELEFEEFCKRSVNSMDHMSAERAIAGPGIRMLYDFVVKTNKLVSDVVNANEELAAALKSSFPQQVLNQRFGPMEGASPDKDLSSVISHEAIAGNKQAIALMGLFFAWYGRFTADAAVIFCPRTIYLTGGIILKNMTLLQKPWMMDAFIKNFKRKARLSHIPETTELKIILDGDCGLLGCVEAINILL